MDSADSNGGRIGSLRDGAARAGRTATSRDGFEAMLSK